MAYVPDNLRLYVNDIGGGVPRKFLYTTVSDSLATITGSAYFSDAKAKGARVGDLIEVVATTGPKYILLQFTAVTSSGGTAAAPTAVT